jgi:hypothetical protein
MAATLSKNKMAAQLSTWRPKWLALPLWQKVADELQGKREDYG